MKPILEELEPIHPDMRKTSKNIFQQSHLPLRHRGGTTPFVGSRIEQRTILAESVCRLSILREQRSFKTRTCTGFFTNNPSDGFLIMIFDHCSGVFSAQISEAKHPNYKPEMVTHGWHWIWHWMTSMHKSLLEQWQPILQLLKATALHQTTLSAQKQLPGTESQRDLNGAGC